MSVDAGVIPSRFKGKLSRAEPRQSWNHRRLAQLQSYPSQRPNVSSGHPKDQIPESVVGDQAILIVEQNFSQESMYLRDSSIP